METVCINYNDSQMCGLNISCGWCPNPFSNTSSCNKDFGCYSKDFCFNSQDEICGIVELLHNITLVAGIVTSCVLIFMAISKNLMNRGLNREASLSIAGIIGSSFSIPIIFTFFFYFNSFFIVFTIFLSSSLLLNLFLYR